MAFWGIEVKPGKPYVHQFDEERGRLHVSQATLGKFSSGLLAKRIVVQCNVGDKSPIYLCSLLPEKNETCSLNLEFEEDDEVMFSVVGPHSVHLSGYFYGDSQEDYGDDYGSDPYEEDFAGTERGGEESSEYDTEDNVNDMSEDYSDDEIDMFSRRAVPNSGVRIEEIIDDEKPANENGLSEGPKKKKNKPDNNDISQNQIVIKSGAGVPVMESEDEDGFPVSSTGKRKVPKLNTEKKAEVKDKITDDGAKPNTGEDNDNSMRSVKRKIQAIVEDGDQIRGTGQPFDSAVRTSDSETYEKQARKNKKKKVKDKEENVCGSGPIEPDEATAIDADKAVAVEKKNDKALTNEKEKKKKNKKKNKKQDSAAGVDVKQTAADRNGSQISIEEKAEAKPVQERTFSNGLVIEELGMGKPDGKRASPGKKVSVQYIGKLKKNGKIFDSNVGRAPFKFRLGVGQVIKGWDVGVKGMRVGDKRRLTIPPSMGYGAKGAGGAIPPNAWLVFDVELVDVN